jgi:uncharacterized cofD-like protein
LTNALPLLVPKLSKKMTETGKYRQKIVTFGGKTGHFQLLNGLKELNDPSGITAVVGSWDSGGSSGVLRTELGVLPPGDIRACILALMEDPEQQKVAQRLFDDRLKDVKGPLKGHSLGNLIGVRLDNIFHGQDRGTDAERALFRVRAQVLPASLTNLNLVAVTEKGLEVSSEAQIDNRRKRPDFDPKDKIVRIYFGTHADSNPRVLRAIEEADKIVFAPGDLFTSILPHLLIDGVSEAINKSKAKLYFILNLSTKSGETDYFKASDYINSFIFYLGNKNRLDFVLANSNGLPRSIVMTYKDAGQEIVKVDEIFCKKIAPRAKIIKTKLGEYLKKDHLLRHDSKKLAQLILET